jgi:hypothetical protein
MNSKEQGAASIIVSMQDGKLKVTHGESTWAVLHERDADAGIWDAIWDVIKNYKNEERVYVSTNFVGTKEDKEDFVREWETLLGIKMNSWDLVNLGTKDEHWSFSAYVTQEQVDEFNMDSDWIVER